MLSTLATLSPNDRLLSRRPASEPGGLGLLVFGDVWGDDSGAEKETSTAPMRLTFLSNVNFIPLILRCGGSGLGFLLQTWCVDSIFVSSHASEVVWLNPSFVGVGYSVSVDVTASIRNLSRKMAQCTIIPAHLCLFVHRVKILIYTYS